MNYAIISAGEGSRLIDEGIKTPKPLVELNGIPLIERLINIFLQNQATSISVIVNKLYPEVNEYLIEKKLKISVPFNIITANTPSSLHSFYKLLPYLQGDKFCLTTVDTVFKEQEFEKYIEAFINEREIDGLMAVTTFIDDEKPLFVDVSKELMIENFYDKNENNFKYVSGGIYCLGEKALDILELAYQGGLSRMRNYQRLLIREGCRLKAYSFSKIIDIDHTKDIETAEDFLKN